MSLQPDQSLQDPTSTRRYGSPETLEPGQLLMDLERRQDEVLEQLDDLDVKLKEVLKGLGATLEDDVEGDQPDSNPGRAAA